MNHLLPHRIIDAVISSCLCIEVLVIQLLADVCAGVSFPQVISRFKIPPGLSVDSREYEQLQEALMNIAEPGRGGWQQEIVQTA